MGGERVRSTAIDCMYNVYAFSLNYVPECEAQKRCATSHRRVNGSVRALVHVIVAGPHSIPRISHYLASSSKAPHLPFPHSRAGVGVAGRLYARVSVSSARSGIRRELTTG